MKKINLKKLADIDFDALLAEAQAKHSSASSGTEMVIFIVFFMFPPSFL